MHVQLVIFSAPKDGYEPGEWEDGACGGAFGRGGAFGSGAASAEPSGRFVVADGATEAYDVRRWVDQLVSSFMSPGGPGGAAFPALDRAGISGWARQMQDLWRAETPATSDYIEQIKLTREGALATFLGCQLTGLDGTLAGWQAVAIGDTVLFHVRDGRLLTHFPALGSDGFGSVPPGISTRPERLGAMSEQLLFQQGALLPGDLLFAATDALAQWIIERVERGEAALWPSLAALSHPAVFDRLVTEQRAARALQDDDVTLLRVRLLAERPSSLVVCL
jgi:hypothetical protein